MSYEFIKLGRKTREGSILKSVALKSKMVMSSDWEENKV